MYIVRLLPLFFFSSVQFFRAGIMYFMSHFQRNGKHRIFISSSLPLVSWKLTVFAKFFFLLIILIGFFLMICLYILLTGNVYITWLDDVSAFVSLYKKDQSATGIYTHVLVYNFEKGGGVNWPYNFVVSFSLLICYSEIRHQKEDLC